MQKRILIILILLVAASLQGFYSSYKLRKTDSDKDYHKAFMHSNKVYGIVLPSTAEFCDEELPLGIYHVRERLDREMSVNTYWHSSTLLLLKKSRKYFKIIEPILKQNNVPDDIKYIAMIESGFKYDVSPRGAAGFWQFMPATARRYGLRVDDQVDERYDLVKATNAACRMLKSHYNMLGSWTLVAASFNAGENRILKEMERQGTNDYYNMVLPEETMRYLYRIIAIKFIYNSPTNFGFYLRNVDLYPDYPTYQVSVDSSISNWINFAKEHNTNYLILKELNPWIRSTKMDNPEKLSYNILLPKKEYFNYDTLLLETENPDEIFNE
ncbi:MAG: lytic transglycosylase domain-containing protein [Lentimicrobiaceae bacterium]|nr:lytic transglycosylase domain-containing protein [Lentimicrobiaceae bacterium]